MKINGHDYTEAEIFEALRNKGYLILPYRCFWEECIYQNVFIEDFYDTHCAVKDGENPSDENIYTNVAIKEFQKKFVKPKLI